MSPLQYSMACLIGAFALWVIRRMIRFHRADRKIRATWEQHVRQMGGEE